MPIIGIEMPSSSIAAILKEFSRTPAFAPRETMGDLVIRVVAYCTFIVGVAALFTAEGYLLGSRSGYLEHSVVEYAQTLFLVATAGFFYAASRVTTIWRGMNMAFALALMIATVREQDAFLDRFFFHGAWKIPAGLLLLALTAWLWKKKTLVRNEVLTFAATRGAGLMVAGFLIVFIFSRLVGKNTFWTNVMGDQYQRVVKNIVEEGTELLGYSLLLAGAVETFLLLRAVGTSRQDALLPINLLPELPGPEDWQAPKPAREHANPGTRLG